MLLSLGLAFFLVFTVAETMLLWGVPFTSFHGLWTEEEQEAVGYLAAMADARKNELERWIEDRRADIMVQGENPALQREIKTFFNSTAAARKRQRARLREHLQIIQQGHYGEYGSIELIDAATGVVLVSTASEQEGSDKSGAPYFQAAVNPTVEEVIMVTRSDDGGGSASLVFCRAVSDPDLTPELEKLVVLVFHDPMRSIISSLLHEGIGHTGEVMLVQHDGRLVTPLRYSLPGGKKAEPQLFVSQARPALLAAHGVETSLTALDYRGVEVLAVTRHLRVTSELGWGLVIKIDRAEVLGPILRTFFFHFAIVAGALVVCAALMALIITLFARPLVDLHRAATTIEAGDFTVRVFPAGSRETRAVAAAFNAMARRLESWHAELTSEVQKRTQELTRSNKALMESEARFRSLFENVHVVTLLINPADGAIVDANGAAAAFYGWSREQLRTMRIHEINTLSLAEIQVEMAAAVHQQRNYFQFRHRRADGSTTEVEVYSGPIQSGGKTLLCSFVHDITPRKQAEANREKLEEQLRQAAKMEAVGRLAGGVAHDFNNMLGVILGHLELLKMDFADNETLMQHVAEMEQAATRSRDITRQLLGFSRKQAIDPVPVDLNKAVAAILRNLGRLIGEDVELVFKPGPAPGMTLIDPSQLDQILMNLAINARDAMPNGGRFIIETENRLLDEQYCRDHTDATPGRYVMLSVSDTGVGMDDETLNHIFEPFFTTKSMGKGTGLGLATVFGIVRQNKGFINVYSEPGKGATFRLYLPRTEETWEAAAPVEEEERPIRGSGRVLLVEDDASLCRMTRKMLQMLGYEVLSATTPQEAMALCEAMTDPPDLLLTDVIMPGMNGRELREALAARWPGLRTLFMSGYTADLLAPHQVLDANAHFLQKPFTLSKLSQKLRDCLK